MCEVIMNRKDDGRPVSRYWGLYVYHSTIIGAPVISLKVVEQDVSERTTQSPRLSSSGQIHDPSNSPLQMYGVMRIWYSSTSRHAFTPFVMTLSRKRIIVVAAAALWDHDFRPTGRSEPSLAGDFHYCQGGHCLNTSMPVLFECSVQCTVITYFGTERRCCRIIRCEK